LACVKHAASVQSEPGSNSYVQSLTFLTSGLLQRNRQDNVQNIISSVFQTVRGPRHSHLSVICFVKERCEIIKYPFRLSKISLDISDIPCYTFQFVRRFGSGEEPNYTPAGENSQYFQRDFFGEIRHVAVG
ncbi:hypothetical protein, partial [Neisseria gonorrhoeae]|uniref:hypothetical protein n=14 Tax=Neisseria gonorrhoeae TaxID=485 RepID=UPI0034E97F4A